MSQLVWPLLGASSALGLSAALRLDGAGLTFPPPWSDEVHFLIPASDWLSGKTFDAAASLNPRGIFWLPVGYTIFLASWNTLLGESSLVGARLSSALLLAVCTALMVVIARRVGSRSAGQWALVFGLACASCAPWVLASNVCRPEALGLTLCLSGLLLALQGELVCTALLTLVACFVHPLLAFPLAVQSWIALWLPRCGERRIYLAMGLTTVLLALATMEWCRYRSEPGLYVADWTYQISRKGTREPGWSLYLLSVGLGLVGLVPSVRLLKPAYFRSWKLDPTNWALAQASLGYGFVQIFGKEMWYTPFSATAVALLVLLMGGALRAHSSHPLRSRLWGLTTAGASALLMVCASAFGWGVALYKGRVQGISTEGPVVQRLAAELAEVNVLVTAALATSREPLLVSSELVWAFVRQLEQKKLWTYNQRSTRDHGVNFRRVIFLEEASEAAGMSRDLARVLHGHACVRKRHVVTAQSTYKIGILDLLAIDASLPFRDCS